MSDPGFKINLASVLILWWLWNRTLTVKYEDDLDLRQMVPLMSWSDFTIIVGGGATPKTFFHKKGFTQKNLKKLGWRNWFLTPCVKLTCYSKYFDQLHLWLQKNANANEEFNDGEIPTSGCHYFNYVQLCVKELPTCAQSIHPVSVCVDRTKAITVEHNLQHHMFCNHSMNVISLLKGSCQDLITAVVTKGKQCFHLAA